MGRSIYSYHPASNTLQLLQKAIMCYTQVKWYTARDDVSITRYVLHTFHILSITVDSIRSILSNTYIHTFNNSPWRNHDVSRNAIGAPGPDPHHYASKTNKRKNANMNKTRKRRKGKVLPRWYKTVVNSLFMSSIWRSSSSFTLDVCVLNGFLDSRSGKVRAE